MGTKAFGVGVLSCLLLATAPGRAQTPAPPQPAPLAGFMTAHEITRVALAAGFDPLSRPLREGTNYVLRAADFRGILMRVVIDAHSGAIRAVNRIVPGPGSFGPIGMAPPPYAPADFDGAYMARGEASAPPPVPAPTALSHASAHAPIPAYPPLPRPRPAQLASGKTASDAASGVKPAAASGLKSDAPSGAAIAAPATPSKAPAVVPLND